MILYLDFTRVRSIQLTAGPPSRWNCEKEPERRESVKIEGILGNFAKTVNSFVNSAKGLNGKKIAVALFLGMAVGGLVLGGTVAIVRMQQNHAVQLDNSVSQLNTHGIGQQTCASAPGGGSPQDLRTDEIVPVSECKNVYGLNTEQGTIEVVDSWISDPLPLCISNDTVSSWYALLDVRGGYTPYDGFVCVQQKGDWAGKIYLSWQYVEHLPCCADEWKLTYYVKQPFCLDSNQYPQFIGDAVIAPTGQQTIPGKEVNLYYESFWKGCHQPNQFFTIISAQKDLEFFDILPSPQSPL